MRESVSLNTTAYHRRAFFAMLLCIICWSTSGLFIKLIDWHPMVISCIRSAIAAVFMASVHGRVMFARNAGESGATRILGVPKIFGANAIVLAAVCSAATKILYVTANKLTGSANAILLQHSAPVWVALAGVIFLKQSLRKSQWAAVALAGGGIAVFLCGSLSVGNLAGDAVALLSGVTFALSMVALRALKDSSPTLAIFWSHLIAIAIGLPFVFTNPLHITPESLAAVFFLGLIQIGAASLLYGYAIKRISAINAALLAQTEPILNPLWVFLFAGELPSRYAVAGGILIIGAVVVNNVVGRNSNSKLL